MSTATLSRPEIVGLRERKRPKRAPREPHPNGRPHSRSIWDQTLAKASELATPDGRLCIDSLANALETTRQTVRARRQQIIRFRGASAWPWRSPSGIRYPVAKKIPPPPIPPSREPLTSDPPPPGWQEEAKAIRAKALEAMLDGKRAPGVNMPASKQPVPTCYAHTPAQPPWTLPVEGMSGDKLREVVATYIAEWKAGLAEIEEEDGEED